jgi:P-type Ca2+ transporter type 2C
MYHNIRHFLVFQLTINLAAVLSTIIFPLMGYPPPLSITQMLWVNLVMDSLAAIAFGGEAARDEYMKQVPVGRGDKILSPFMLDQIGVIGTAVMLLSLYMLFSSDMALFFHYGSTHKNAWSSAYFAFFVLAMVANAFNVRTAKRNPFADLEHNSLFLRTMMGIVLVQMLLTSFGGKWLHGYGLGLGAWFVVVCLSAAVFTIGVVHKSLYNKG